MRDWLFEHPVRAALLMIVAVGVPALFVPYENDDYFHLLILRAWVGEGVDVPAYFHYFRDPFGFLNLFGFFHGDPALMQQVKQDGTLLWWTLPELKTLFWRPLSSLLAWGDFALFGEVPFWPHVHSMLWYSALVVVVSQVYRRTLRGGLLVLVILLFAVDARHLVPAVWLANRNALVAATGGMLSVVWHLRWRADGWRPGLPLSLLSLGLGLAGGEVALGCCGYLGAYALFGERGPLRRRLLSLVPAATVAVGWLIAYRALGFGAYGSGLYLDPLGDSGAFFSRLVIKVPILVGAQFGGLSADFYLFLWRHHLPHALANLLVIIGVVWLLRAIWRELEPDERQALGWLIPGGLIALLPVLATFPMDRLLLVPGVAGATVSGAIIRAAWRLKSRWRGLIWGGRVRCVLGLGMGVYLLLGSVMTWWVGAGFHRSMAQDAVAAAMEEVFPVATLHERVVVVINAADPAASIYVPLIQMLRGKAQPRAHYVLAMAPYDVSVTRVGPQSIRLEILDGSMLEAPFEQLFRGPNYPLEVGDVVSLRYLEIEVEAMGKVGPRAIQVRFKKSLAGEAYAFCAWQEGALRELQLPKIGASVVIPWTPGPMML